MLRYSGINNTHMEGDGNVLMFLNFYWHMWPWYSWKSFEQWLLGL